MGPPSIQSGGCIVVNYVRIEGGPKALALTGPQNPVSGPAALHEGDIDANLIKRLLCIQRLMSNWSKRAEGLKH